MQRQRDRIVTLVGVEKLAKGLALAALGVALLLHRPELFRVAERFGVHEVGLHPDRFGLLGFAYAAVFMTEGVALLARWSWSHGFAIFVTGSFIPFEIVELARHANARRAIVLVLNVAIVAYLAMRVVRARGGTAGAARPSPPRGPAAEPG